MNPVLTMRVQKTLEAMAKDKTACLRKCSNGFVEVSIASGFSVMVHEEQLKAFGLDKTFKLAKPKAAPEVEAAPEAPAAEAPAEAEEAPGKD